MRELNPSIETPGDIMHKIRALRATPNLHAAAIQEELTRAEDKLAFLGAIENSGFAVRTLHAYAIRTQQLLEKEKASWHIHPVPENDKLES